MTDEEFEKELDKMYEEIDQYQAEMEELGLINYGDTGYYWRNPEEYEKDKKICELESKIERLEYLLKVSDKALELACEELNKNIDNLCEYCEYKEQNIWYGSCDCDMQFETDRTINYFKTKSKEKMKSER